MAQSCPTEQSLRVREAWLTATLTSVGDGIIATDGEGRISFINPVATALTGWAPEEATGRPLEEVFVIVDDRTHQPVEAPVARVLREDGVVGLAHRTLLICRSGKEIPIDDSGAPIRDESGNLAGVVMVFRDITERRRAEEGLRESEERFRLLVDSVQDYAIIMLDPEGKVASWNAGAERIKGWSATDILGRHFSYFYTPEDLQEGKPARELALAAARGRFEEEGWRVRKDGSRFWASVTLTALRDETGRCRGFAKVTRDVTERLEAEVALRTSEARLAGIVGSAMDAILSVDEEQCIVVFNAAAERMFRCEANDGIGQPLDRFIPQRFRAIHSQHVRNFGQTGGTSRSMTSPGTLMAVRADGEEFPIEATISQAVVGEQRLFTVILRDITERQQAEEALREHAKEMARADRAKDQFLAMLAHELRNPMGAISNAVHLLKLLGPADANVVRAREIIERQATHTDRLLDDLLNVSRIARGKITLNPIRLELALLVRDTAADFRSEIEEAGLTLVLELPEHPVRMERDPTRLAQALGNLLANAVKFTDRGGQVTVRLAVEPDGRRAAISVRDTGTGIEPEVLPYVFDTFAQADRTLDRSRGGLGLGLPLVKGLVELHGGEVRGASKGVGHGAEFTLLLPLAPAPAAPEQTPPSAAAFARPIRVLIVEDNHDAAESLRILLEFFGCQVAVACSGPEAVEMARRSGPEVVLCDLGLPGMSGYEVAAVLRQEPTTATARLIAVSGYGQEEDRQRTRAAGFESHLTKPVDLEELQRLLASHAGPSRGEWVRG